MRRAQVALVTIAIFLVACSSAPTPAPSAATAAPLSIGAPLPNGRLVFDSDRAGTYGLYTMRVDGGDVQTLSSDPQFDSWWPRLSPDRMHVVFYRTPKGVHDTDFTQAALWAVNADGSGLRQLRAKGADGWEQQGHADWSADGTQLAMFGGTRSNPQIFVTNASGSQPRKVTADRPGTNLDPSWSPDGKSIVFVGCAQAICFEDDYEIYVVAAAGGDAKRLTTNNLRDHDPYYSPDGKSIAWLSRTDSKGPVGVWNIKIMNADGSGQRSVTNDGQVNSKPNWARDGSVIYFHRLELGRSGWGIYSIKPDGSSMLELTKGAPGNNEFPSP
jgi:Tol biopolymer transport system component